MCSGEAKGGAPAAALAKPKPAAAPAVRPAAAPAPAKTAISKPAPAAAKPVSTTSSKSSLNNGHHPSNGNAAKDTVNAELQQENLRLLTEVNEMKTTLDGLEKERDFYFGKLRDIEVLCQEYEAENLPALKKILDILYATTVS